MLRALVVDDSRATRSALRRILQGVGCDVVEAEHGVDALEVMNADPTIELVLVDWNMPVMDGLAFVKNVRERGMTMPIIMVTTEGEKTKVITAIKAGVNNYVIKPFTPEVLAQRVEETLAKKAA